MTANATERLPEAGWWRDLDIGEFFAQLSEYADRQYPYDAVEFTHDVLIRKTEIGEAGNIEIIGGIRGGIVIGFFSNDKQTVIYRWLDPRATLLLKSKK